MKTFLTVIMSWLTFTSLLLFVFQGNDFLGGVVLTLPFVLIFTIYMDKSVGKENRTSSVFLFFAMLAFSIKAVFEFPNHIEDSLQLLTTGFILMSLAIKKRLKN